MSVSIIISKSICLSSSQHRVKAGSVVFPKVSPLGILKVVWTQSSGFKTNMQKLN